MARGQWKSDEEDLALWKLWDANGRAHKWSGDERALLDTAELGRTAIVCEDGVRVRPEFIVSWEPTE